MRLRVFNWGPACSHCRIRLEADYRRPPRAVGWLLRSVLPRASWRWCRRCLWRGIAFPGVARAAPPPGAKEAA